MSLSNSKVCFDPTPPPPNSFACSYLLGCRHPGSPWTRRCRWTTPGRSEPLPHWRCPHLLPVQALLRKAGLVTNSTIFFQLLQSKPCRNNKKLRCFMYVFPKKRRMRRKVEGICSKSLSRVRDHYTMQS